MTRTVRALVAVVAVMVLMAPTAGAAEPDVAARQAEAVRLYEEGEAQYLDGRYDAAAERFEAAYAAYPDPAYLFNIGLAFEKQGRWPLVVRYFERFLAEAPTAAARPEVERRLAAARTSREAERATITITTAPAGATARVPTDDEVPPCTTPCTLRVDPGPTTVTLERGNLRAVVTRGLGPAERWQVTQALTAAGVDGTAAPPPRAPDRTASVVAWSVGGAGLVAGVVFGVLASGEYDQGEELAARGPLGEADQATLAGHRDAVRDHSTIADVGFAVALTGAVVGAVLWLTADAGEDDAGEGATGVVGPDGGALLWRF